MPTSDSDTARPSPEHLACAFDLSLAAKALPEENLLAILLPGNLWRTSSLFEPLSKAAVESIAGLGEAPSIVAPDTGELRQLMAKLRLLLEGWSDWFTRLRQERDWPPVEVVERVVESGEARSEHDLYHLFAEPYPDGLPGREELVKTCSQLTDILDSPEPTYREPCQLGLAVGLLLVALEKVANGGPTYELRDTLRRFTTVADRSPEVASTPARDAAGKIVSACTGPGFPRDWRSIFWSYVILQVRAGLAKGTTIVETGAGPRSSAQELLDSLSPDPDHSTSVTIAELAAALNKDPSNFYKWMNDGFPRTQHGKVDIREAQSWLKEHGKILDPTKIDRINKLVQDARRKVEQDDQELKHKEEGRLHYDDKGADSE